MPDAPTDTRYRLADNLSATAGRIFLTGSQALARLLLSQQRADAKRGINTAGFVTGHRGSPLAGVDMAMWRARALPDDAHIKFLPAINDDLARPEERPVGKQWDHTC